MWKDIKYYTPGPDNKICNANAQGILQVKSKGECLTKLKAKAETLAQNQQMFGFYHSNTHPGSAHACRYGMGSSRAHAEDKCNATPTQRWPWCGKTASSAGPIQCANIRFSGAPVSVYEHANKGGWEATYDVGNYSFHAFLAAGAKNDRMSSIRVSKGYIATLFQHGWFNGWSQEFKEGVYNLPYGSARNDDASSIKVRRAEVVDMIPLREITHAKALHHTRKMIYYNLKDKVLPATKQSRANALNAQANTIKKQREDLVQMLSLKYSKLTQEHKAILETLIKRSADLEKKRAQLDKEYQELQRVYNIKKARLTELRNEIRIETANAAALTEAYREELQRLKDDKRRAEEKIFEAMKNIQKEKIKIDNIKNKINIKIIEYSKRLVESRARGEQILGLEDIKRKRKLANNALTREIQFAPSMLKMHKESLAELEAELAEYKKNPENDPIFLLKLLDRKKKLMAALFDAGENRYNMNTERLNRTQVVSVPTDILLDNQEGELKQNNRKIDNLTKDLSTSAKSVQINNNEYRKRDYFMFILKYVGIFFLLMLLTALLIKNETIPKNVGYMVVVLLTLGLTMVIGINVYVNKNRNSVYFNKRDWSGVKINGISAKCPKP